MDIDEFILNHNKNKENLIIFIFSIMNNIGLDKFIDNLYDFKKLYKHLTINYYIELDVFMYLIKDFDDDIFIYLKNYIFEDYQIYFGYFYLFFKCRFKKINFKIYLLCLIMISIIIIFI